MPPVRRDHSGSRGSREFNFNLRKTIISSLCRLVVEHGADMLLMDFKSQVLQVWDMPSATQFVGSRSLVAAVLELKGKAHSRLTTDQVGVAIDGLYRVFKKLREIKDILSDITLMKGKKPLCIAEEKSMLRSLYESAHTLYCEEMECFIEAAEAVEQGTSTRYIQGDEPGTALDRQGSPNLCDTPSGQF